MKPIILTVVLALSFSTAALAAEPTPCPEGQVCLVPIAEAPPPCGSQPCAAPAPCNSEPCATPENTPLPHPDIVPATIQADVAVSMGPPQAIQEAPVLPPAPPSPPAAAPEPDVYRRHFGVQLGLGVPDAATLGIVYRPVKYVRGELGGAYNYLTGGVQVGVTALPFGRVLSFTGECGYFFGGNANTFTKKDYPALRDMTYEYCNTHAGLDFGRERVTFFIHGGMSYFNKYISNATQQVNSQGVSFTGDPHLTAWFPSAKLGLIVYFR